MALPTSTIAMAVLTCIPFGLAVRDTVRQRFAAQTERERAEPRAQLEMERASGRWRAGVDEQQEALAAERDDARRQAERELEEREQAERATAMAGLLGTTPTSLGPLFGDIAIGMTRDQLRERSSQLAAISAVGLRVHAEGGARRVQGIVLVPHETGTDRQATCDLLRAQLVSRWGRPDVEDDEVLYYLAGSRRASFSRAKSCHLRIEWYQPADTWIGRSPEAVIALAAIGKPVKALIAQLEERSTAELTVDDLGAGTMTWSDVGVGIGSGRTMLSASVSGGRVTGITAMTAVHANTQADIMTQLTALFGSASEDGQWSGKPPVTIDERYGNLTVTAGKLVEESP